MLEYGDTARTLRLDVDKEGTNTLEESVGPSETTMDYHTRTAIYIDK